jgi:hypothetical protein
MREGLLSKINELNPQDYPCFCPGWLFKFFFKFSILKRARETSGKAQEIYSIFLNKS